MWGQLPSECVVSGAGIFTGVVVVGHVCVGTVDAAAKAVYTQAATHKEKGVLGVVGWYVGGGMWGDVGGCVWGNGWMGGLCDDSETQHTHTYNVPR